MENKTRIIFMGTPDFSVPALKKLAGLDRFEVCLVVTQPDRKKGRGRKLAFSPVKEAGCKLGIEIFQPESINTDESAQKLKSLCPDFFVVAAFGQLLSQRILDIPRIYPVNIHASLLPEYRGASPIQAAIANRDTKTGVTTIVMSRAMDAGDILLQAETGITEDDTALDLHDRLALLGADLIVSTIDGILDKTISPKPQDHARATYVKMLKKSDGRIDWTLPAKTIQAHINAMNPWPGAFTSLDSRLIKIYKACSCDIHADHDPGTIIRCNKSAIHVATGKGCLAILELMGTSGKRLNAAQFLCGAKITPPVRFDM